jgi:hypothetical protein
LNVASLGIRLPETECVLTPHPGELSRLLKLSIAEIQANRFCAMRQAVEQTHQCVLLKGPYSLVGTPGQPVLVNSTGNPGMATGGMGDVLSGIIATLLAQDLPAYYAAGLGMYWHGAAGDRCAKQIGQIGYSASDLADALPAVRTTLVALQHSFQRLPGLLADGRDMGTVIFPHAPLKVFLTASAAQRAERRHKQLISKGISTTLDSLRADLEARDARDSNRSVAPLKPAQDAFQLDNSQLSIEASVDQVLAWWKAKQPF